MVYNKNQLSLVSPKKHVDYGLARLIGINGVDVYGSSTIEIKSPKMNTLPFYAFSGCDYGPQTLQQPNNGHSADLLMLWHQSETNAARMTSVTPSYYPAGTVTGTLQPIDILFTAPLPLTGVTEIGFFESGNATEGPAPVTVLPAPAPGGFTIAGNTIHLNDLPDQTRGVTGVQQFWYIRVKIGGQWSTVYAPGTTLNAPQLTIGDPPLICGQGSSSGNFGTLLLSNHVGGGADKMGAANVALGLDSTLAIYPTAGAPANGRAAPPASDRVLAHRRDQLCRHRHRYVGKRGHGGIPGDRFLFSGDGSFGESLHDKVWSRRNGGDDGHQGRHGQQRPADLLPPRHDDTHQRHRQRLLRGTALALQSDLRLTEIRLCPRAARTAVQRWEQQVPDHRLPPLLHHRPAPVVDQGG